jgi:phage tail-like protein
MPSRRVLDGNKKGDPIGSYNFKVEIDGVTAGAFKTVDGLACTVEVIEYQDGDDLKLRKRPGRHKYGDITLKKGYIHNTQLEEWWTNTIQGKYDRRSISVVLFDNIGKEIVRWDCYECFPIEWKLSGLDGKGNDVLTEEIKFAVEDVKRS